MGRMEGRRENQNAGLDLIREMRSRHDGTPVLIYTSRHGVSRRSEILEAGGQGVTASASELFEMLRGIAAEHQSKGDADEPENERPDGESVRSVVPWPVVAGLGLPGVGRQAARARNGYLGGLFGGFTVRGGGHGGFRPESGGA
jgi:hypothetical protein